MARTKKSAVATETGDTSAGAANPPARKNKQWKPNLDAVLIECMLELVQTRQVEGGNFKNRSFSKLKAMLDKKVPGHGMKVNPNIKSRHRYMKSKYAAICDIQGGGCSGFGWDDTKKTIIADDDDVFEEWAKSHRNCRGLNKIPFLHFDKLAIIFGKDRAHGTKSSAAADIESECPPEDEDDDDDFVLPDASVGLDEEASERVLEHIINEGIDYRASIPQPPSPPNHGKSAAATGSNKRQKTGQREAVVTAVTSGISKLQPYIEKTTLNIERMANSFCQEDELVLQRATVYDELKKMEGLTPDQVISASMMLLKDDGVAKLFFQLPSEAEKFEFLLRFMN